MATFRKVCSDIINALNAKNLDDRLSYRFLSTTLQDSAAKVLNQDGDYRRLFQVSKLWKRIDCINMCEVSFVQCNFDISGCQMILRSVEKLPPYYTSKYGDILKINNINYSKEYRIIKPEEYKNYKNRPFQPKTFAYCWIIDGHIYIPDSMVETITVRGMFKEDVLVERLNGVEGAECKSLLDSHFEFPDYIVTLAKEATEQLLGGVTKRVPHDENPNLNQQP